jgi:glutamate synthase (NADPH) small chain
MTDPHGFRTTPRETAKSRPVDLRLLDWNDVYEGASSSVVQQQAGRCMDCGIPFCHNACPLGNLIPDWNDRVWRGDWRAASEQLHATNNFPEFTGRVCPAPCEAACVAGLVADPVTIKQVEQALADTAWDRGWLEPLAPSRLTDRTVAVVGSGPAGLAVAQQLTRAGHTVVVFERADRPGGLLRYGIPEFKLAKQIVDRRIGQLTAEGTRFRTGVTVGVDVAIDDLRRRFDAVVLAIGATVPRELDVPGRRFDGVHQAMEYLPWATRAVLGDVARSPIDALGRHVVVIGGGDTGSDCMGTAHRQGAASVTQLEIQPMPPDGRPVSTPWPTWPLMMRTSSSQEEGGERVFAVNTRQMLGDAFGRVRAVELVDVEQVDGAFRVIPGTERELPADLVLLALGFAGPERELAEALEMAINSHGCLERDQRFASGVEGVFVAGDAGRGQSLVVWAIAEGRACASAVDAWLSGASLLPAPITASDRPLTV